MRDYNTWNLKIVPFVFRVYQWWDKEFAARLDEMAIVVKMNKRYVDDINMAIQATPVGMRYKDGKTHVDEISVVEDEGICNDEGQ